MDFIAQVEGELGRSYANDVTWNDHRLPDELAIDEHPIGTPKVHDLHASRSPLQERVTPGHSRVVQDYFTVGIPAEHEWPVRKDHVGVIERARDANVHDRWRRKSRADVSRQWTWLGRPTGRHQQMPLIRNRIHATSACRRTRCSAKRFDARPWRAGRLKATWLAGCSLDCLR